MNDEAAVSRRRIHPALVLGQLLSSCANTPELSEGVQRDDLVIYNGAGYADSEGYAITDTTGTRSAQNIRADTDCSRY